MENEPPTTAPEDASPTSRRRAGFDVTKVYSVPRRFDLATLFVVTVAFALLFTLMRVLRWPMEVVLVVVALLVVVGLAQALLFKGKRPRLASRIAGTVFCTLATFAVLYFEPNSDEKVLAIVLAAVFAGFWGILVGYIAGLAVAGVFLIADALRSLGARKRLDD